MAIDWKTIPIDFGGSGVDTKSDKKMTTRLTTLENALFTKNGELVKRKGRDTFTTTTEWPSIYNNTGPDTTIDSIKAFGTRNDELLVFESDYFHSYSSSVGNFIAKGLIRPLSFDIENVNGSFFRENIGQAPSDGVLPGGFECIKAGDDFLVYTWTENPSSSTAASYFSLYDLRSESFIYQRLLIDSARPETRNLRAVNVGDFITFFYIELSGETIYTRNINLASDEYTLSTATQLNAITFQYFDLVASSSKIFIAAVNKASDSALVYRRSGDGGTPVSGTNQTGESGLTDVEVCALAFNEDTEELALVYNDNGTVYAATYDDSDSAFGDIMAPTSIQSSVTFDNSLAAIYGKSGGDLTDGNLYVFYEDNGVRWKSGVTSTATFGSEETLGDYHSEIYSRPFFIGNTAYIATYQNIDDTLDDFIALYDIAEGTVQLSHGLGSVSRNIQGVTTAVRIPLNVAIDSDDFYIVYFDNTETFLRVIKTTSSEPPFTFNSTKGLFVCGGLTWLYDGTSIIENGFLRAPVINVIGETGTGGNFSSGDVINAVANYEWVDDLGNKHRSAASVFSSRTLSGNATSVSIDTTTYTPTQIRGSSARYIPRNAPRIRMWHTESNGSIYFAAASEPNDVTTDEVTITSTNASGNLNKGDVLYISGGELDDFALPACVYMDEINSRLFFVPSENREQIGYTKKAVPGLSYTTHPDFRIRVGNKTNKCKAVKGLNNKVVVYLTNSIAAIFGDGPNALGLQNTFSDPQEVSNEIGIKDVKSLTEINQGHVFKSAKGFYLLTQSLVLQYIGQDVEEFNDETITATVVEDADRVVRFYTNNDKCLILDYSAENPRWTVESTNALDAILWNNKLLEAASASSIFQEASSSTKFKDDTTNYKFLAETGWISFADRQGHQRVRKALLMGRKITDHILKIEVAYNYSDTYTDEFTFDTSALSVGELMRYEMRMTQQKCEAIRFKISETDDSDNGGFAINSLMLEVGVKRGTSRQRSINLRKAAT